MIISSEPDTNVEFKSDKCTSQILKMDEDQAVQIKCTEDFTGSEVNIYKRVPDGTGRFNYCIKINSTNW